MLCMCWTIVKPMVADLEQSGQRYPLAMHTLVAYYIVGKVYVHGNLHRSDWIYPVKN